MAVDGDEVDDDDDRDMLLLSLLLCWNAALQRGPCDLPLVWVHVRVVESLWLQWPVAAGCGKPVAAMACGRWLWKALATGAIAWSRCASGLAVAGIAASAKTAAASNCPSKT